MTLLSFSEINVTTVNWVVIW